MVFNDVFALRIQLQIPSVNPP